MKILFIWEGTKDLPKSRAEAIAETMNLYPEAEYYCITKMHHFFSDKFKVIPWMVVMEEMMLFFGFQTIPYEWNRYMCFSDWARFWYLGNNADTLYLDTDCRMLKRYDFANEWRILYPEGNICILYSPDNAKGERLLALLDEQARKHVGLLLGFYQKMNPEWSATIPNEYFRHK